MFTGCKLEWSQEKEKEVKGRDRFHWALQIKDRREIDITNVQVGLQMDFGIFYLYYFWLEILKRAWGKKNEWGKAAKRECGRKSG